MKTLVADWVAPPAPLTRTLLRDRSDLVFLPLAAVHAVVLWWWPCAALIAIGLWWNLNTIAHNFIHRPFFRSRMLNRAFALYLTALNGVPQTIWRERHLDHHAGRHWRLKLSSPLVTELVVVMVIWLVLAALSPQFLLCSYMPGYLFGLGLCALHGRYEHAGGTTSHYGRIYNWLFFNDGYHCEHHAFPSQSWRQLPRLHVASMRASRWPAVLRWLDECSVCRWLNVCERLVLHSAICQRFVVNCHARAIARLTRNLPPFSRVGVVGGGLFPRSALIARDVFPEAAIAVIDVSQPNLCVARSFVQEPLAWINEWFDRDRHTGFDLMVFPLAYVGDREELYLRPPAPVVLIHDWIWRVRGRGTVVSWWLLKRINLVQACEPLRC